MNVRVCCVLLLLLGCSRAPNRLEIAPLAEGEWTIVDATRGRALLRKMPRARLAAGRRAEPADPVVALLRDTLVPVTPQMLDLPAGRARVRIARVTSGQTDFHFVPDGRPRLTRSPANPDLYAFEHEDAIWVFRSSDRSLSKLTRDIGLDSLRAMQREGEVILYWSVDPMWSANGDFIAFITNRDFVRAGRRGQAIRVVHSVTAIEKDIFNVPGVSVHTDGVFHEEFVFSSSRTPGVFGVQPDSESLRKHSDGFLLSSHPGGKAMLINENGHGVIVRPESRDTLPRLPTGHVYSAAQFSPSGERLAAYSTDQQGGYTLHVHSGRGHTLSIAVPGGPSSGPAWVTDNEIILTAAQPRAEYITYRVRLR
jgi:hypothetical protein